MDTPCIEHPNKVHKQNPYPRVSLEYGQHAKQTYAHRKAWMDHYGPIPKGMHVCHRCDNPRCVNIDHLFLGTPSDNMRDMIAKGRKPKTIRKLTPIKVKAIRGLKANNHVVAALFGIAPCTVGQIRSRRCWKHI